MRPFRVFAVAFLMFFGVYILYFNLVMALNVVGGSSHLTPFLGFYAVYNERWTSDYYFGFQSIIDILDAIPEIFTFGNFLQAFEKFVATLFPLSDLLDEFSHFGVGGDSIFKLLQSIGRLFTIFFDILISPFKMLVSFIELNILLFKSIIQGLQFIDTIVNGRYNTPMQDWFSPLENYFTNNPISSGSTAPYGTLSVSSGVVVFH